MNQSGSCKCNYRLRKGQGTGSSYLFLRNTEVGKGATTRALGPKRAVKKVPPAWPAFGRGGRKSDHPLVGGGRPLPVGRAKPSSRRSEKRIHHAGNTGPGNVGDWGGAALGPATRQRCAHRVRHPIPRVPAPSDHPRPHSGAVGSVLHLTYAPSEEGPEVRGRRYDRSIVATTAPGVARSGLPQAHQHPGRVPLFPRHRRIVTFGHSGSTWPFGPPTSPHTGRLRDSSCGHRA
eukprot:1188283-Prorocentrum_minimum.AAC.1